MKKKKNKHSAYQPLTSHFSELRYRLITCVIFFILSFGFSYLFSEEIFTILAIPLKGSKMIYTNLTEGFFTYLKVAYFSALFLSIPFFIFQVWKFIQPALYPKEQKNIIPFLIMSPLLFYLGGAFVYFLVIPNAWNFFLSFQNEQIELSAKVSEYLSLTMKLIIAFGICFQIPVIIGILAKLKIIKSHHLKKFRKYFIILAFTFGAILTPPDVISQLFLASVIIVLFELSNLFIKFSNK